jgi:hypothetical protein
MKRTIQFWYLVNPDGSPLAGQFPYTRLQNQLVAVQNRGIDTTATPVDGPPIHLSVIQPRDTNAEPFFVLYRNRRQNPSHMNDSGTMRPMPFQQGQQQEEATYLKFLSRNVVGFLMHGDSPRPNRLTDYLALRFRTSYELQPILRGDLDTAFRELTAQHIEIAIPAQQAAHVAGSAPRGFANGLSALSRLLEDGAITLRFSPGRGGNALMRARKRAELIAMARSMLGWAKDAGATRAALVGKGPGENEMSLDLLDRKFAYRVSVPADEFIYGQTEIRDDTPLISQHWEAERTTLEPLAPDIGTDIQNEGLLDSFHERGT